jgi:glycosyltransferase involved in cell wall biosynthesis
MPVISTILWIVTVLFVLTAVTPAVSLLIAASRIGKEPLEVHSHLSIAVVILAGKDIRLAFPQVDSLLKQSYSNFRIYVVVNSSEKPRYLPEHSNLLFIFPEIQLPTRAQRVRYALNHITSEPDAVLIIDSGDLLQNNALASMNDLLSVGFVAVQGQIRQGDSGSDLAVIKALKITYSNSVFHEIPYLLGASAGTPGTRIAVKSWYLRLFLDTMDQRQLFPGTVEIDGLHEFLVDRGHRIAYCKKAVFFDTHPLAPEILLPRMPAKEWILRARTKSALLFRGFRTWNWNIFYSAFLEMLPPVQVQIPVLLLLFLIGIFLSKAIAITSLSAILIYIIHFFAVIAISNPPETIWRSVAHLPGYFFRHWAIKIKSRKKGEPAHVTA